jgi:GTP-binding protein
VILVATKCDNPAKHDEVTAELYELRISDVVLAVSAAHNIGIDELNDSIVGQLKRLHFGKANEANEANEAKEANEATEVPRIAILGKPNVGKSSLINALMSEPERTTSPRLVSEIPGTTRDTTDTVIRCEGEEFILVDTAGLKRKARTDEGIEHYAALRTLTALQTADLAVLMIDGQEVLSNQDKRIAKLAVEAGTGLIILINKVDLLTREQREARENEIAYEMRFCRFAPVLACSTVTREGLLKLFPAMTMALRNRTRRISDRDLHRWLGDALGSRGASALRTAKHITQAEGLPPTFVLFVRDPKKVLLSELRYLDNALRKTFGFEGTPVRWVTKGGKGER